MAGTVAELLADIKVKAFFQADDTVLTDDEIVSMANKELQGVIVPKIIQCREDFFTCFKDYTLATATKRYRLPSRKVGGRILDAEVVQSNGDRASLVLKPRADFTGRYGFSVENDEIVFRKDVPTGFLRVYYNCRPPNMDDAAVAIGTVASVSSSSLTPSMSETATRELIRANSPWTTISPNISVDPTTATNADDLVGDTYTGLVQAGDIFIAQNSTHLVPLPIEFHDWLAQRVAIRIKEIFGHGEEMQLQVAKLADMERDALALISPRVDDQEKVIVDKETLGWRTW